MDSGKAGEAGAAGMCGLTFGQQWLSLVQFHSNYNVDNNAKCWKSNGNIAIEEGSVGAFRMDTLKKMEQIEEFQDFFD